MGKVKPVGVRKSIATRWLIHGLGFAISIIIIAIVALSFSIKTYIYNSIESALRGRSDEMISNLSLRAEKEAELSNTLRDYVRNFTDKNELEVTAFSVYGDAIASTSGMSNISYEGFKDMEMAMYDPDNFGNWEGTNEYGEKIMAITRIVRDRNDKALGAVRYVTSLEKADRMISQTIGLFISIGAVITVFLVFSGIYFIRSIITPVKQISESARIISSGNFNVRLNKKTDDEIGYLVDTVNDMAVELGNTEKLKNEFISSVSHELRTPLTSIRGWAETLASAQVDEETFKKGLRVISKESERLSGLVEELLDFSRLQSGRLVMNMVKTDILAELDEVVFAFTDRARAENVKLIYDEPDILPYVKADANRIRQVLVNLLDNAFKYNKEGGEIKVAAYSEKGMVYIKVSDSGIGIREKDLPNIKKKFYKVNTMIKGSGIGLAVSDEIINIHGGSLTVESIYGTGTTVTVTLPGM
ncbi:MAG: HAMP domain-containing histidine kinase [Ruminococcaceae bacterium]|nr:HAMP domain-containing histidine kinase [Oscillospiraceae bacterium]